MLLKKVYKCIQCRTYHPHPGMGRCPFCASGRMAVREYRIKKHTPLFDDRQKLIIPNPYRKEFHRFRKYMTELDWKKQKSQSEG